MAVIDDESIAEMLASTVEQPVPDDKPDTAECSAEEQLPEMFAEPVTGISKKLANKVARARELASDGEQEEIVITAPFGTFVGNPDSGSQAEPELDDRPDSVQEQETIEDSGQSEQADALPAAARSSATGHAVTPETTTPRQGFFRRMLSLFSRSGK